MEVHIVQLSRFFTNTKAVDDVSFSFHSGQIFGFVGPNGAGKTTTMRILATLDEPTSGDIFVGETSVVQYPDKVRRLVGYMPDSLPAHRDITVHEYLDFFARAYGLKHPHRTQVVENIEEFTGLTSFRDKTIAQISKGMKQRVSLARAIVHEPEVLVLDEPAAGLDPRARIELRELMLALKEQGKAILVSSHILPELEEVCDGVVFIEQGKLLKAGKIDAIIESMNTGLVIMIRAKDLSPEELSKKLLETPLVEQVRILNEDVAVTLSGKDEEATSLLRYLLEQGISVVDFRQQRTQLEDLFMNITKDRLQ